MFIQSVTTYQVGNHRPKQPLASQCLDSAVSCHALSSHSVPVRPCPPGAVPSPSVSLHIWPYKWDTNDPEFSGRECGRAAVAWELSVTVIFASRWLSPLTDWSPIWSKSGSKKLALPSPSVVGTVLQAPQSHSPRTQDALNGAKKFKWKEIIPWVSFPFSR